MKIFEKYLKLVYFEFLFKTNSIRLWVNSQATTRIRQIIYTQLLCSFASPETNQQYSESFLLKDIHLSVTQQRTEKNQRQFRGSTTGEQ